ncbi:carbohydrate ABC transporter permease [Paenibacillus motobuensis]|uniref:carbohydrate ABC transporter permease n=1 Tax=Paenibacillus TaxID=44249 RepID=UPI00203EF373|nr:MULTISPECIES: carbohydrate ABC transporter permease [Paenibacillus]MCM3041315.1 carbohydrate ABC transporter permease [Paenibacillus lutimineralis]MCM3648419.1 carbohydrate ABC transporter permease [Paenibacillus motobuensis]
MRLSLGDKILQRTIYILLTLLAVVMLYPFWNSLVISFNLGSDTSLGGVTLWPRAFTLENYYIVFQDKRLLNSFGITILRTLSGTLLSVFFTALLAYGMSKKTLLMRKYYMIYFIVTMFFSGGLIPTYMLIRSLGMLDTLWVFIIPGIISIYNMIVIRTFFSALPDGLEESAKIDGCSNYGIFFRIVIPVSGPVLATISLFTAVGHWNDWFTGAIYITKDHLLPIQTLLRQIMNSNIMTEISSSNAIALDHINRNRTVTTKSLTMATMMIATIPIILTYPFLQKYFVKGVLIGSLKE